MPETERTQPSTPLTASELRMLLFELLYEQLQGGEAPASSFVGLQGDNVVIVQAGGAHLVVTVHLGRAT